MFKQVKWAGMACLAVMTSPVFGAVSSVAGLANPLDNSGVSARATGMGSAFVGVADDSSSLFWNPAGLGVLPSPELALHHSSLLAGIVQETLVAAVPLGIFGGLGVSGNYVNYGSFDGYDEEGAQMGSYSANRYGLGLGWGKEISRGLALGAGLKGSLRTVSDNNYSDLSVDLGGLWSPVENLTLGAAYCNLGTEVTGNQLASSLRMGGSFRLGVGTGNQLLLAASTAIEPQGVNRLQFGLEDTIQSLVALRLGYQASLADYQAGGLSGMSAGAGFLFNGFALDYAYLPFGELGSTQRISLAYHFAAAKP